MHNILRYMLFMIFLLLPSFSFASTLENYQGVTIYTKVNMRIVKAKNELRAVSSNFLDYPELTGINMPFKVQEISSDEMILSNDNYNMPIRFQFIKKHSLMEFEEYLDKNFSVSPVKLPNNLTKEEISLIKKGKVGIGMSREALFLALGYPPGSLNVSFNLNKLLYQVKRFSKAEIILSDDKVVSFTGLDYAEKVISSVPSTKVEVKETTKYLWNKVNLKAEYKGTSYYTYTTNYIGVPKIYSVGTKFTIKSQSDEELVLIPVTEKTELVISYVNKHTIVPFNDWIEKNFSTNTFNLPTNLTKKDLKIIKNAEPVAQISAEVLFLTIGYPPANLNPNKESNTLTYMKKKFNKITITIEDGKVISVKE